MTHANEWLLESERPGWPSVPGRPDRRLTGLLGREYLGVTDASPPHRLLLPATPAACMIVKICDSPHRPPAFVHGSHGRYSLLEGECATSYLEVWFAPLGAYRVLGPHLADLGQGVVDLQDVFGADGRRLAERLRSEATWRGRFAVLDDFLLRLADAGPRPSPEVAHAWRRMVRSEGRVRIRRLADEVGWSHNRLIARFSRQIGLTPKTVARLVRYEAAVRRATTSPAVSWEQVAADGGYADQAHLIREFRTFTGVTPVDFARRTGAAGD